MKKNFISFGTWANDESLEIVEIDNVLYILNGWNGDKYYACRVCVNRYTLSEEDTNKYIITPVYEEIGEDEYKIVRMVIE
jgi:hypothetical protein